jgi:hypothetical protein
MTYNLGVRSKYEVSYTANLLARIEIIAKEPSFCCCQSSRFMAAL